jgi:hypothetical protein
MHVVYTETIVKLLTLQTQMFGCIIRSQQYVAKHVLEDLKHLSLELLYVFTVALSH